MTKFLGKVNKWNIDLVIRLGSFWWGVHYSDAYKSFCVALIPCVVLRVGKTPYVPRGCS